MVALGCNAAIRFVAGPETHLRLIFGKEKRKRYPNSIFELCMWMQRKGVKWTRGRSPENCKICNTGCRDIFILYISRPLTHSSFGEKAVPSLVFQQSWGEAASICAHAFACCLHCNQQRSACSLRYFVHFALVVAFVYFCFFFFSFFFFKYEFIYVSISFLLWTFTCRLIEARQYIYWS